MLLGSYPTKTLNEDLGVPFINDVINKQAIKTEIALWTTIAI
jgi:hypothetical protein